MITCTALSFHLKHPDSRTTHWGRASRYCQWTHWSESGVKSAKSFRRKKFKSGCLSNVEVSSKLAAVNVSTCRCGPCGIGSSGVNTALSAATSSTGASAIAGEPLGAAVDAAVSSGVQEDRRASAAPHRNSEEPWPVSARPDHSASGVQFHLVLQVGFHVSCPVLEAAGAYGAK